MKPLQLLAIGLVIAAIVKELRLPPDQRSWHGVVAGFIPYDFRAPTLDRVRASLWNPEGAVFVGRPFGVGWTVNLGAVVARLRSWAGSTA